MCGIAAAYCYGGGRVDPCRLRRIGARIANRGPDGEGEWFSETSDVGLAHRRLAIIDLSEAAAQPMSHAEGRYTITYNGEIYNYRELRRDLTRRGYRFRTRSDTEVLLHLYAEYGSTMVRRLRGMFAFAIWDSQRRRMLLARDPYGIKPLYYADDGRSIWIASQVKALLAGGELDTSPDPAGHAGFFLLGSVPEPYTLFRGIRALPAGCTLQISADGPKEPFVYADVGDALSEAEVAPFDVTEPLPALREALLDSVRKHLVADVDVGVFLSAGMDSTMVAALAAEAGARLRTVTLGFEEYQGLGEDEVPAAEEVARRYGGRHETVTVAEADFHDTYEDFLASMDQPATDGINTYLVGRAARSTGLKVALSGLGGDELFGSYPSFDELPRTVAVARHVPVPIGRSLRVASAWMIGRVTSPKYAGLFEYGRDYAGAYLLRRGFYMPWELSGVLDPDLAREGLRELQMHARLTETARGIMLDRFKITALESGWYMRNQLLRDTDWAGMAHGLEVRVPLVDWHLLQRVAPIIAAHPEIAKRDVAAAVGVPSTILERPKAGFITPIRRWLVDAGIVSPRDRSLRGLARHVYQTYWGST